MRNKILFSFSAIVLILVFAGLASAAAPTINNVETSPATPGFGDTTTLKANVTKVVTDVSNVSFVVTDPAGTVHINSVDMTAVNDIWESSSFVINVTGTWNYVITATDNESATTVNNGNFKVNNTAPTITSPALTSATEGVEYTYNVDATDLEGEDITYSLTTAPAGMTIVPGTGLVKWTPTQAQVITTLVKVTATDTQAKASHQEFNISVSPALEITDLDVESGSLDFYNLENDSTIEGEPNDEIEIELEITNNLNIDAYEIVIFAGLYAFGDDGEFKGTMEVNHINPGEKAIFGFSGDIPATAAVGVYDLQINITAIDDNHEIRKINQIIKVNVTKQKDNLVITDLELVESEIKCMRNLTVNISIANTGLFDEDDVSILVNPKVDMKEVEGYEFAGEIVSVDIPAGTIHNELISFDLEYALPGTYDIDVEVTYWYVNSIEDYIRVTVEECTLPDKTVEEDGNPVDNWIDLWDYTTNGYNATEITYTIVSQSNPGLINCVLTKDTTYNHDRYVDCANPAANQFGTSNVSVSMTADGYTYTNTFVVTVTSVNDLPQVIGFIGPVVFDEDGSDASHDLDAYVTDVEDSDANITWTVSGNTNVVVSIDAATHVANFSATADWSGTEDVTLTATDLNGGQNSTVVTVTVNPVNDDAPVFDSVTPAFNPNIDENADQSFTVTVSDADGDALTITWYLDSVIQTTGLTYTFVGSGSTGTYNISAIASDGTHSTKQEWVLTVSNAPVSNYNLNYNFADSNNNLNNVTNLVIENTGVGKIDFGSNLFDLSETVDFVNMITVENGVVGIDTSALSAVGGASASVTLYGLTYNETPIIYYNTGFGTTGTTSCPASVCSNVVYNVATGTLTFDVTGFSTFWTSAPVTNTEPQITSSADTKTYVNRTYSYDVTATDADSDTLTYSLSVKPSGMVINSSTGLITWNPTSTGTYSVTVDVNDGRGGSDSQSYTLTVSEGGMLEITDLEIKVDGERTKNVQDGDRINDDLKPESTISMKIEIANLFTDASDMEIENIVVRATLKDIDDGDDLEEEADEFDLKAEKDDKVTLTFDIPLKVDEGDYSMDIEVEGEDEDGNVHELVWTIHFDVDKEKHDVRLYRTSLNPESIQCNRLADLTVEVINLGNDEEDDVTLKIKSTALGLSISNDFELTEDIDDDENTFRKVVHISVPDSFAAGTYPIDIEVYYDGKKSDSEKVNLAVSDCSSLPPTNHESEGNGVDVHYQQQITPPSGNVVAQPVKSKTIINSLDSFDHLILLILANIVLIGLIIFAIGAIFVKGRR